MWIPHILWFQWMVSGSLCEKRSISFPKKNICIMRGKTTWANTSASTCYCHAFFLLPNSKALALSSSNMSNMLDYALMRLIVGATVAVRLRLLIINTVVIPSDPSVIFHHHHSSSLICTRCLETNQKNISQMVVFPLWCTMAESVKNRQQNKSQSFIISFLKKKTVSWVPNVRSSLECSSSWGHPFSPNG